MPTECRPVPAPLAGRRGMEARRAGPSAVSLQRQQGRRVHPLRHALPRSVLALVLGGTTPHVANITCFDTEASVGPLEVQVQAVVSTYPTPNGTACTGAHTLGAPHAPPTQDLIQPRPQRQRESLQVICNARCPAAGRGACLAYLACLTERTSLAATRPTAPWVSFQWPPAPCLLSLVFP